MLQDAMAEQGAKIAATMVRLCHELDPTRVVSAAVNGDNEKGVSDAFDIIGFNYGLKRPDAFHKKYPKRPIYGSETVERHQHARRVRNRSTAQHGELLRRRRAVGRDAGSVVDVLRNARLGGGRVRLDGLRLSRRTDALRMAIDQLAVRHRGHVRLPQGLLLLLQGVVEARSRRCICSRTGTGTGREGDEIPVWVYSNLDEVELLVNGKSLGSQKVPHLGHVEWKVRYEPGAIEARGSRDGKVVLTEKRETTGPAVSIRLTADRTEIDADGEDVAILKVEALDKEGRPVPTANNSIGVQGLGRREADRRGQRRSQLPGERQGAPAVALQWTGAGHCAVHQAPR